MPRSTQFPRFILLSVALLALAACDKPQAAPDATKLLVGRWELAQSSGGLAGGTYPADPARRQEIIFGANGQAQFTLNGTVTQTLPYALVPDTAYITRRVQTFVQFGTAPAIGLRKYIEQLNGTQLVLVDDFPDGFGSTYTRR